MSTEPELPDGITYGGSGPGGEFYSKDVDDLHSHSLWTMGDDSWTADELRAIANHKTYLEQAVCKHANTSTCFMGGSEYGTTCEDCGESL